MPAVPPAPVCNDQHCSVIADLLKQIEDHKKEYSLLAQAALSYSEAAESKLSLYRYWTSTVLSWSANMSYTESYLGEPPGELLRSLESFRTALECIDPQISHGVSNNSRWTKQNKPTLL